jgi:hypothetical protein
MVLMVHSREDSPPEKGTGSVLISESWLLARKRMYAVGESYAR